ncbi:efflux RND transporter periplasmic adaptor subunit [Alienimonas californiensis]|uniref:Efflux pump periplasmic linker BepF n=1 Tax=Alienimonas californiensis TaxID=2527989 RepID=A0A517PAI8_9PLAN|nr:efflux RND transporter periplasmic adaptor subunit [Alienimonas californiensis]QDT16390.1 Efflux pump periplasmic linker BepF [Alienimonas californiensis]
MLPPWSVRPSGRFRPLGGLPRGRLLGPSGVCVLVSFVVAGCQEKAVPQAPPPPEVVVAEPLVRQVVEWDDYTARLRALDTVEIRPRVGGYLQEIHFTDGAAVEKDALLFTIDPRPFEAALAEARGRLAGARASLQEAEAMKTSAVAANVQAESELELRESQLSRMNMLVDRGVETQESYDIGASERKQAAATVAAARAQIKRADAALETAKADIAAAEAAERAAELTLSFTEVRSPIAGRTSRHLVDAGNLVAGEGGDATLLTTVVSQDPVHAFVSAPERAFLKYARQSARGERPSSRDVQNPAVLQLADEEGYPHVGAIDFVDNTLDAGTDTMTGRLRFPNPDGLLTPGLFAKVKILGSGLYDATLVPDSAVALRQTGTTVLVVVPRSESDAAAGGTADAGADLAGDGPPADGDGDGTGSGGGGFTVEPRAVTLGPLIGGLRVVREGLSSADRVVVRGLQKARPGEPVRLTDGEIEIDEAAFERDARLDLARAVRARRNAQGQYELPTAGAAEAPGPVAPQPVAPQTVEPQTVEPQTVEPAVFGSAASGPGAAG